MKIFLAQQNYHIGNFEANTNKIVSAIETAKAAGGDLIVFPELAVCGYPPRDFLEFEDFIVSCEKSIDAIAAACNGIAALVGGPARNPVPEGKDLFNAAWFLKDGKVRSVIHKTLLPNYDIFDEYRYFEPAFDWHCIDLDGVRIAVTICEDIWNLGENPMYRFAPMEKLMEQEPQLMINLSASPFDYLHAEGRRNIVYRNVHEYGLPMVYCNAAGAQTDLVFDGGSVVVDASGATIRQLPYFAEALESVDWQAGQGFSESCEPENRVVQETIAPVDYKADRNIAAVHQALLMGIRDYFSKMGFGKAIVASSGGMDSALVLALACEALGADNVTALLMPSEFSTGHSVSDAVELSQNLGNPYNLIPIKNLFDAYELSLAEVFEGTSFNIAEENLQSRIRGTLVMAMSNKFGSILLNTSNKSELATGYGTLYGDMAGGLGVVGDLYKTQVYALGHYLNRDGIVIPQNILDKEPSAELRPGQKDSDSLPPYDVLDPVLFGYIERRKGPRELISEGHDPALVARILKLVNTSEYKRNQFCPIIRVSPKAFGAGRRMPIVGKYLG